MRRITEEEIQARNDKAKREKEELRKKIENDSTIIHNQNIKKTIIVAGIWLSFIITISIIAGVFLEKIDVSRFDFTALLSTLLAFFAMGLSVFFYVKANETSNRFYDNTYNFTKDISEKIGRMDERVGERLSSLGDNYSNMLDQFNSGLFSKEKDLAEATQNKEKVEGELIKELKEALYSKSINTDEKINDLKNKISILEESQSKVTELESEKGQSLIAMIYELFKNNPKIEDYILRDITQKLIQNSSTKEGYPLYFDGYIDNNGMLTESGIEFFRAANN